MQNSNSPKNTAFELAIKLLSIRLHTTAELKRKLLSRKYGKEEVEQVLVDLTNSGYLNDQLFAENFLDNLIKYKNFGFYGLKMKLLTRGISTDLAEKLLSEKLNLEIEKAIAERLISKKNISDKMKLAQSLARKGFRSEVIRQVVN